MSSTTFFVGLLPPPALTAQVRRWQERWKHVVTVPHVTLKAPGERSPEQLAACREVCQRTAPFEVRLGGVQTFGDRVIFLQAEGAGLHRLHARLVAAIGEPAGTFELDAYHPHLTLALNWRPMDLAPGQTWADVLASARTEFGSLEDRPLAFPVASVTLFRKDAPGEPYSQADHWPLHG